MFNSNFKHINIKKFYFNKDTFIKKKKKKRITLEYIQTEYMLADAWTKNNNGLKMTKFTNVIFDKKQRIEFWEGNVNK